MGAGLGRFLVGIGLAIVAVGLVLWLFPRAFAWFGTLPGDIRVERDGTRIYVPITSMLLVSLALTLLVNLLAWLFELLR